MSYVKVPAGLTRSIVGRRIVYESLPPGLRVKIWKLRDFDDFKQKGRFSDIDRGELDFSTKKINEPEDYMEIDEVATEPENMEVVGTSGVLYDDQTIAVECSTQATTQDERQQTSGTCMQLSTRPPQQPENKIRNQVNV